MSRSNYFEALRGRHESHNCCTPHSSYLKYCHYNLMLKGNIGSIYSRTERAVVWLGPKIENCDIGFKAIRHIANQIEVCNSGSVYALAPGHTDSPWYTSPEMRMSSFDAPIWKAIYSFCGALWFGRLWLLQEVHLGIEVIMLCGLEELPWPLYRRAIMYLCDIRSLPYSSNEVYETLQLAKGSCWDLTNQPFQRLLFMAGS